MKLKLRVFLSIVPLALALSAGPLVYLHMQPGHDDQLWLNLLLWVSVALVGSTIVAWLLTRSIVEPLSLIAQAVKDANAGGEISGPPALLARRGDEIGQVAGNLIQIAKALGEEAGARERTLGKLERYQKQLLELNQRLAKKLYENRVMLSLWAEQEKSGDTKDFLSHILEELLQGLPFGYGCIIIRPLSQIGPEVILARIERSRSDRGEISVTDILERSDRTLWLSSLSPELKEFLLRRNQDSANNLSLLQEIVTASIEPSTPVCELSVVSMRLAQGKEYMGSLHLISDKQKFQVTKSDEQFLLSVAGQISVALENRSLQHANRMDSLTRLFNRGYMNDRLREEMLRSSRSNRPFTFLLLDIDHFKKVNDSFGHPAGDELLVNLAALLKQNCRASDAICRYGGEEIGIILADTQLQGAQVFAENLRKTIENEVFPLPEGKSVRITASMGLAEFPSQAASVSELIKHADDALYAAKREGRNTWRAKAAGN
jgi:diguanylate cyclase (GGDEF)-like protein